MPELPELEGVAQLLNKNIKFMTIKDVSINNASMLVNIRGFELKKVLRKQTFVDVERRGKFLIMTLHDGNGLQFWYVKYCRSISSYNKESLGNDPRRSTAML